jgi:hypothetical protein
MSSPEARRANRRERTPGASWHVGLFGESCRRNLLAGHSNKLRSSETSTAYGRSTAKSITFSARELVEASANGRRWRRLESLSPTFRTTHHRLMVLLSAAD